MSAQRVIAIVLGIALALTPAAASARSTTVQDPSVWRSLVERLDPAAFVSVRLADGTRMKGTVVAVGDVDFTVQPHTRIPVSVRTVRYDQVESLEPQKRPMSAGRKVITGIGVGVVTYLVLVAIALSGAYD